MSQIGLMFSSWSVAAALLFVQAASARTEHPTDDSGRAAQPSLAVAKLTASDGVAGNALGISVAASGNTLVVGEDCLRISGNPNCNTHHQGIVYVYQEPKNGWRNTVQTAELTPSNGYFGDEFGTSVAVSGDAIVVGAGSGKAYVFVKPVGGWKNMTETAQLTDGAGGDGFGSLVAICKDTIVVGAPNAIINGNQSQGAVFVFDEPPTGWATTSVFNAELTASDGSFGDSFGTSAAVSGDMIVVGAPFHNNQTGPGQVYVFVKPPAGWANGTQTATLTRSNRGPYDEFGLAVAISGNTIVVGAAQAVGVNNGQGVVDVFVKPSTGWSDGTETAELVAPIFIQHFGCSVAIKGRNVVVGTFSNTNVIFDYAKPAKGGWKSTSKPRATLTAGTSTSFFGFSVAMTASTVVAGAPYQTVKGHADQGAIYVFSE
jgi:hypothetical protein